jgi:hypothetical protein
MGKEVTQRASEGGGRSCCLLPSNPAANRSRLNAVSAGDPRLRSPMIRVVTSVKVTRVGNPARQARSLPRCIERPE